MALASASKRGSVQSTIQKPTISNRQAG